MTLIFLQHDRSGGNTVCSILQEEFGPVNVFKLGVDYGKYNTFDDFLNDTKSEKRSVYMGHFSFGMHQHIQGSSEYFTLLRNPVDRVLSLFRAWSGLPLDQIDTWLETTFQASNGMVKRLCGFDQEENDGEVRLYDYVNNQPLASVPVIGEAELQQAIDNLDNHFPCVLFTEHFEEGMALLQQRYGTEALFSLTRQFFNHNASPTRQEEFPAGTIKRIKELNALDIRLYEKYRERLLTTLSRQDTAFREEVRLLKEIAGILTEPGVQALELDQTSLKLNNYIQNQMAAGNTGDGIEVLRRFISKPYITRDGFQASLDFIREHASPDIFEEEQKKFQDRFGTE